MSVYSLVSSLLSYVFTTIIYLFIFSVIALIYMDIKKMNRDTALSDISDTDTGEEYEYTARLCTVKSRAAAKSKMKTYYRIGEAPVIVGRGKNCDICIDDMFLSQEHFQIWHEDGLWYIADLGSKNGTLLNDVQLKKVQVLSDGDEISFGGVSVIFEEE